MPTEFESRKRSSIQRVTPSKPAESSEVSVVAMQFTLMLDRQGRQMCVGCQIPSDADLIEEALQDSQVPKSRLDDMCGRLIEPGSNMSYRLTRPEWTDHHPSVRH